MTTFRPCSTCRDRLDYSPGGFSGCASCGALVCAVCRAAANGTCPRCRDGALEADAIVAEWLLPHAEWRSLAWEDYRFEYGASAFVPLDQLIASVTPANIVEVEDALEEDGRKVFWTRVLDHEVERRLGMFEMVDGPTYSGEWQWVSPEADAAVACATSFYVARTGSTAATLIERRAFYAGLRLLGPRPPVLVANRFGVSRTGGRGRRGGRAKGGPRLAPRSDR